MKRRTQGSSGSLSGSPLAPAAGIHPSRFIEVLHFVYCIINSLEYENTWRWSGGGEEVQSLSWHFFFFCVSSIGTRKGGRDVQHRDGGHQRQGDVHSGQRWQIPFSEIHQEWRQRHLASGQLANQRALPLRYCPHQYWSDLVFVEHKIKACWDLRPLDTIYFCFQRAPRKGK